MKLAYVLGVVVLLGSLLACDRSGPVGVGLEDGIALAGQIVDQFDKSPLAGVKVKYQRKTAVTDANGRFAISGRPSNRLKPLKIGGSGVVNRNTYTASTEGVWGVVPSGFNLAAYEDIGRGFSTGTIRWARAPKVYIDTRRYCFSGGDPLTWAAESEVQARAFVSAWMAGTDTPQVVVTNTPPQDFTAGTIVVRFSECDSDYGGKFIGYARLSWNRAGEIESGVVFVRAFKYRNDPNKRKGILGHEIGHTLGYHHVTTVSSFMQPSLGSKTDLKPFDHLAAKFLYGRTPQNVAPDTDGKYSGSLVLAESGYWEGP